MEKLHLVVSEQTDPFYNLALENQLLLSVAPAQKILFFYQNKPCVVMGRFQNPWLEVNIEQLQQRKITLVRRQSGGGSVYHDLGNLCFSFIQGKRDFERALNNQFITKALNHLGIPAFANERSDLVVNQAGEKKFSGCAFKQKKDRSFHHGTLLIDSDLSVLNRVLKSKHDEIQSKSIKSKPATVINLKALNSAINKPEIIHAIQDQMESHYQRPVKSLKVALNDPTYLNELQSWQWLWGETPLFEFSRSWADHHIEMQAHKGIITKFNLDSYGELGLVGKKLVQQSLAELTPTTAQKILRDLNLFI